VAPRSGKTDADSRGSATLALQQDALSGLSTLAFLLQGKAHHKISAGENSNLISAWQFRPSASGIILGLWQVLSWFGENTDSPRPLGAERGEAFEHCFFY
jgi:hypothetical protein